MMQKSFLLVLMVAVAVAQMSTIDLSALGAVGDNSAMAGAKGAGEKVTGTAEVVVTETSSSASSSVSATSDSAPTPTVPTPHPVHTPTPHPHPAPKPMKVKPTPKHSPNMIVKKVEKEPQPVCEDVKNATCADIEKYEHCGFCLLHKYPIIGSGCTYSKKMVKKEGMKGEYDVVLVPECECEGSFIMDPKYCPTCHHALEQLIKCADAKADKLIEIPEKCLKEVGVTVEHLVHCGYVKVSEEEEEKKPIVSKYVVDEKKEKEHDPKVVIVQIGRAHV
eukprot:TRINITY_DN89_c0_g1_i6.p1 TRINITY_DN89_c0_g1~~TRINITY_DN89_c0_g1_i6.p1  ORF type:complete len:277 (-),score=70.98 TRINITY_DN89_c0_g1_i6:62-892(-)